MSILVVHSAEGVKAYWNVCQHLPVPLDGGMGWLPDGPELVCQTHGAIFRSTDGYCTSGPCEDDALEPIETEVDGDELFALIRP